jgi:site-specific recombinase xerD
MQQLINDILHDMSEVLSAKDLYALQIVLQKKLNTQNNQTYPYTNIEYMDMFISAKRIEGCSERTLAYYKATIEHMLSIIVLPLRQVQTDDLRSYLAEYQSINNCSKTTVDNIRRNLSSFFSWLEAEDYIIKSPIRRIHKIRTGSKVKETLSEECIERLRDSCLHIRDLAMIDLLYSTGIRVGELVNLNIGDINFEERECIVYGKGNKQRKVYFDAKAKLHLKRYLEERNDYNEALFVTLDSPFNRLKISGVEIRLRKLGRLALLDQRVHPHKFRRSMATRAIDKGMPIEQVQKLLGHQQIDTTMHYAMVNQSNVKISHRKFIG